MHPNGEMPNLIQTVLVSQQVPEHDKMIKLLERLGVRNPSATPRNKHILVYLDPLLVNDMQTPPLLPLKKRHLDFLFQIVENRSETNENR